MQPSGQYDKSFREGLLCHLLRTPELSRFLSEGATPRPEQADFEIESERAILIAAQEVAATVGLLPGAGVTRTAVGHVLATMVTAGQLDPTMGHVAADLLIALYRVPAADFDPAHFLYHLPLFLRERRLVEAARRASVLAPDAHVEEINHAVRSSSLVGRRARVASIDDELPPPVEPIPTGFLSIDTPMMGGPGRLETVMVCGGTGVGKTSFMLNLQRGHALFGYRTALFQLEIPPERIRQRRSSLCARMDYNLIRRAGLHDDGPTREEIQAQVRDGILAWTGADAMGRMLDFDYSQEEATVEMIDRDLTTEAEADEPIEVAMVDWLECLELPARQRGLNKRQMIESFHPTELRHKLILMAGKLTKLAVKHNLLMYVVTQTSFEVQNQSVVRMKNNAEAKGTSRRMSTFWGLGMSPEDEERGIIHLTADKTRDGRQFRCELRRRLDQQRFEDVDQAAEAINNN